MTKLARELIWDSDFFGFPTAQTTTGSPTEMETREIMEWCQRSGIRCLYLLADAADTDTLRIVEKAGFRLADLRITLALSPLVDTLPTEAVREATWQDLAQLKEIATTSHRDSRFYHDPGFPRELCDKLYETWIERSVTSDFAQQVFVAELNGRLVGYVSCHLDTRGARIGLLAVDEQARGRGFGTRLIRQALYFFREHSCTSVTVVTQGRNLGAQRLYQKSGFRTQSVELWYHKWFKQERSAV